MKKNIKIHYICSLVLFAFLIILLRNDSVKAFLDDVILLENRNPGYYSYLHNPKVYRIFDQYEDTAFVKDETDKDLHVPGADFSIERRPGNSFFISGENTLNNPVAIDVSAAGFKLKNGVYQISGTDYDRSDNLYLQVITVDNMPDGDTLITEIASTREPGDKYFEVDNSKHAIYSIRLVIEPGHVISHGRTLIIPEIIDETGKGTPIASDYGSLCFRERSEEHTSELQSR